MLQIRVILGVQLAAALQRNIPVSINQRGWATKRLEAKGTKDLLQYQSHRTASDELR